MSYDTKENIKAWIIAWGMSGVIFTAFGLRIEEGFLVLPIITAIIVVGVGSMFASAAFFLGVIKSESPLAKFMIGILTAVGGLTIFTGSAHLLDYLGVI